MAYRHSLIGGSDAAIIRRDQDIADNGSVGTLDFAGSEAFAPATATITLAGLSGGETVIQGMFYQVGANCATATLYTGGTGGTTFTASGIPSGQQLGTDFHGLFVSASTTTASRLITEYFHTLAARTVTLGAAMPTPTITDLGGPYKRLQAAYTLPTDYEGFTSLRLRRRSQQVGQHQRDVRLSRRGVHHARARRLLRSVGVGQHLGAGLVEHR